MRFFDGSFAIDPEAVTKTANVLTACDGRDESVTDSAGVCRHAPVEAFVSHNVTSTGSDAWLVETVVRGSASLPAFLAFITNAASPPTGTVNTPFPLEVATYIPRGNRSQCRLPLLERFPHSLRPRRSLESSPSGKR